MYRVEHKKVDHFISLPTTCILYTTNTLKTVPRTLMKMLFNMTTLRCNNWRQSYSFRSVKSVTFINDIMNDFRKNI